MLELHYEVRQLGIRPYPVYYYCVPAGALPTDQVIMIMTSNQNWPLSGMSSCFLVSIGQFSQDKHISTSQQSI